jgi:hypothetical protein
MNAVGNAIRRRGTTTIELLVSFTLLTTVLGAALPLVVRHGRILNSARQYRMALDELSNQAERITAVSHDAAIETLDELQPSPFAAEHLPGAMLTADLASSDGAERVTLSLSWEEPGRRAAPVSLVAWLPREAVTAALTEADVEEDSP